MFNNDRAYLTVDKYAVLGYMEKFANSNFCILSLKG